jgi:hypothetical protein
MSRALGAGVPSAGESDATAIDALSPMGRAEDRHEVAHAVAAPTERIVVWLGVASCAEELPDAIHERVLLP